MYSNALNKAGQKVSFYARYKIALVMQLTAILLFAACIQVSAGAYAQKVTIIESNAPLKKVFKEITRQTGYSFIYAKEDIRKATPVTLSAKDEDIRHVLNECFANQPLTFLIQNNIIVVRPLAALPFSQAALPNITVKGQVTDSATGKPLEGVSILVKGEGTGTVTDKNGQFSLDIPDNAALVISYLGYNKKEIPAGNETFLNISLSAATTELNQLVVVGYGSQKKSDITGSITSIKGKSLRDIPSANLGQSLQGLGAGIDVQKGNGNNSPGEEPTILIRGTRSLHASNSPLLVVDGIPFNGSMNDLSTDNIKSIEVLKDASAAAIYGSRGANGVILITTVRGEKGKPVISYSGYVGMENVLHKYNFMNGSEFAQYRRWAYANAFPSLYQVDDPSLNTNPGVFAPIEQQSIQTGKWTDFQELLYRTGLATNHQLGVSGGSEKTQYSLSAGYYDETGILPDESFKRFSLKFSLDQELGKYVKIGLTSLNDLTYRNDESIEGEMPHYLYGSPLGSAYDSSGNVLVDYIADDAQIFNPLANYLPNAHAEVRKRFGTFNSFYLEASLAKGLKYRLNAGIEIRSEDYGQFYAGATSKNKGGALSTGENSNSFEYNYTLENLILYDKNIGRDHKINFTGLYSLQEQQSKSTSISYSGVAADYIQFYNPGYAGNLTAGGALTKWDILSFMGRLNYSFKDRYLLTLTMRADASSRLATGNKWHGFPSVAVAWNLIKEPFINTLSNISNLKLRASIGRIGNTSINPYETLGRLSAIKYNFGSSSVTGFYPTSAPNPNLNWEYTSTINVGLDFGFWDNRVSGTIEAYHQYTDNLLLPQALPPTSGIPSNFLTNIGKTENKGLEFDLSTINIKSKKEDGLSWTTDLNIYINRGKIVALANGISQDIGNNWFVGYPINSIYDYKKLGIWQIKDSTMAKQMHGTIGQIKVADINGDGKIDASDRTIIGANQPKWEGGMTNRIRYKNFDLTLIVSARQGFLIQSQVFGALNTLQGRYNHLNIDYWTPTNPTNAYPAPNYSVTNAQYSSTLGYLNGSFIKIRSIGLGYNLPQSLIRKMGVSSFRAYITITNPLIIAPYVQKYHGTDPETAGRLNWGSPATYSTIFGIDMTL